RRKEEARRAPGRPRQGLGDGRPRQARRKGVRGQLRRLPPAERKGRRSNQGAGRLAHRAGRRQEQTDPDRAERQDRAQCRHAAVEAAVGHRHRGSDQFHQEQLVQQDRPDRAAGGSACAARQITFSAHPAPAVPKENKMSAVLEHPEHTAADPHHHAPAGWQRWVYATNHKDIGTMYLVFAFTMFMVGGVLALLIRAELFEPGLQIVNPELFNQLTTMHGLIMVFGAIMPGFVGFANWMIPLQIGAPDMAFARMNNLSFWLLIPAALMLVMSFFMPGGAPAAGWTIYAPLTLQMGPSM